MFVWIPTPGCKLPEGGCFVPFLADLEPSPGPGTQQGLSKHRDINWAPGRSLSKRPPGRHSPGLLPPGLTFLSLETRRQRGQLLPGAFKPLAPGELPPDRPFPVGAKEDISIGARRLERAAFWSQSWGRAHSTHSASVRLVLCVGQGQEHGQRDHAAGSRPGSEIRGDGEPAKAN